MPTRWWKWWWLRMDVRHWSCTCCRPSCSQELQHGQNRNHRQSPLRGRQAHLGRRIGMDSNTAVAIVGGIGVGGIIILLITIAWFTHKEHMAKIEKGINTPEY